MVAAGQRRHERVHQRLVRAAVVAVDRDLLVRGLDDLARARDEVVYREPQTVAVDGPREPKTRVLRDSFGVNAVR